MDGRGDGTSSGGNRQPVYRQPFPGGDQPRANQILNGILAWMGFFMDLGIFDGAFGLVWGILRGPEHPDEADNIGNNNAIAAGIVIDDADHGFEDDLDVEVNQYIPEVDPFPGVSRRRSREEDREEVEGGRFWWWVEFTDSDSNHTSDSDTDGSDSYYSDADDGADVYMDANQEFTKDDPQPGGSKKRSREDDEEEDEHICKKTRSLVNSDTVSVHTVYDRSDSSSSDELFEDAVNGEEVDTQQKEGLVSGRSRKRSREENEDEDFKPGKFPRPF